MTSIPDRPDLPEISDAYLVGMHMALSAGDREIALYHAGLDSAESRRDFRRGVAVGYRDVRPEVLHRAPGAEDGSA